VADPRGFLQVQRRLGPLRPIAERLADHGDVHAHHAPGEVSEQARRCMGCGVPFCMTGCPLGNLIPDWNDLVRRDRWREAIDQLHQTNNFPELTGGLCPAPCEEACVLTINDDAVTIKGIEAAIAERAWDEGWITPLKPAAATGRRVAVVGSGPAGLAAAQQLARAGHAVTVYERDDRPGGLLRYGIPDYKLEKRVIDRRIAQLEGEGVELRCGVEVDAALAAELHASHDAVILCTGAQAARPLDVPGAALAGVHLAMPYLRQRNRAVAGLPLDGAPISAAGKRVAILGAGDTSADCLGNALREGPASVVEIAHGPQPPLERSPLETWPEWPSLLRTYPAHEEAAATGNERRYALSTTRLEGKGRVQRLHARELTFEPAPHGERGRATTVRDVVLDVDLVLVAIGFSGVERADGALDALGVNVQGGRVRVAADFATGVDGIWAAGDCVRGADLIVTAIADGREAARAVDLALMGRTRLPARAAV
jgi:glutamate synthase (NADPH/NADH) small chain